MRRRNPCRLLFAAAAAIALVSGCSVSNKHAAIQLVPPSTPASPSPSVTATPSTTPAPRSTAVTDCSSSDLQIVLTSDRTTYGSGQDVNFRTTATNTADHPCRTQVGACPDPVVVDDSSGHQVWTDTPPGFGACAALGGITLQPGGSQALSTEWDQRTCEPPGRCPGSFVAPGSYTAVGRWAASDGELSSAPLTITIS